VALLWKITCNLRHPMGLGHPVGFTHTQWCKSRWCKQIAKVILAPGDHDSYALPSITVRVVVCCCVLQCVAVDLRTRRPWLARIAIKLLRWLLHVKTMTRMLRLQMLCVWQHFQMLCVWQYTQAMQTNCEGELHVETMTRTHRPQLLCVLQCVAVCCSVLQCVAVDLCTRRPWLVCLSFRCSCLVGTLCIHVCMRRRDTCIHTYTCK